MASVVGGDFVSITTKQSRGSLWKVWFSVQMVLCLYICMYSIALQLFLVQLYLALQAQGPSPSLLNFCSQHFISCQHLYLKPPVVPALFLFLPLGTCSLLQTLTGLGCPLALPRLLFGWWDSCLLSAAPTGRGWSNLTMANAFQMGLKDVGASTCC